MIQRIQSLYLFAAILCIVILFFVPLYSLVPGELSASAEVFRCSISGVYQVNGENPHQLYATLPLMLVFGLAALILSAAVFLFKNRPLQVKLVLIGLFMLLAATIFQLWSISNLRGVLAPGHTFKAGAGWFLIGIAFLLGILAVRGIRADEKLVRSADRLR